MLSIGRHFEINIQMLKEWGKLLRKYLSEMCVINIMSLSNVVQGINGIQDNLVRLLEQLRDARNSNE